jgi:hypothetical protein
MQAEDCAPRTKRQETCLDAVEERGKEFAALLKDCSSQLKAEEAKLVAEKREFEAMRSKLREGCPPLPSRIKLNVGGKLFVTSLDTLRTREPGSFLAAMVSGEWKDDLDDQGAFFIDRYTSFDISCALLPLLTTQARRDGKHFRVLLNYLRTGEFVLPQDKSARRELQLELEFYQFENVVAVVMEPFEGSVLQLTDDHRKMLLQWFRQSCEPAATTVDCQLLYRMSRDGPNAETFYASCGGRSQTFLIARSTSGYLFGGYTSGPWTRQVVMDPKSFIFTLTNPYAIAPTKFPVAVHIGALSAAGPTWGAGNDLVFGHTLTSASCNHLQGDSTGRGRVLFTGSNAMQVVEVEVWACRAQQ